MALGIGLAISGLVGAGASIFGATTQANAAGNAINAQRQEQQQANAFLQQQYNTGSGVQAGYVGQAESILAPYANQGTAPLSWYNYMTGAGPLPGSTTLPNTMSPGQPGAPAAPSTLGQTVDASGNLLSSKAGDIANALSIPGGWSASYDKDLANQLLRLPAGTDVASWLQSQGVYSNLIPKITDITQGFAPAQTMQSAPSGTPSPVQTDAQGNPLPQTYNPTTAPLTAPFTAGSLASTPGYQFALSQGLMGTNNANVATGWGGSGANAKALTGYASGEAQQVYNQQFQNYLAQNAQIANLLLAPAQLGAGAASTGAAIAGNAGNANIGAATQTGTAGAQVALGTGQGVANSTTGIGNAIAGGAVGASNSLSNALLQYNLLNSLKSSTPAPVSPISYNAGAFGSSGGTYGAPAGYGGVNYLDPSQVSLPGGNYGGY